MRKDSGYLTDGRPIPFPFDFDAIYRQVAGSAVAWRAVDYETQPDEDTEWSGYEEATGRILAHMVGDDRMESFDPDDLYQIDDGEYCIECGQIGCTADGRDREDAADLERTP
jgi:hypothetical protein